MNYQDKTVIELRHFDLDEFRCKCGLCSGLDHLTMMDEEYLEHLDALRHDTGVIFNVNSGFRCPLHPREKKKLAPGPHQTGKSSDIAMAGRDLYTVLMCPRIQVFTGIGMDQQGDWSQRFLHLDTCEQIPARPRPHVWTY